MLLHWTKYAKRLGERIMELITHKRSCFERGCITLELPNEGSKLDFEKEIKGLLGHLHGHLHNHDITIQVIVK
jgi:hypothetical protein